MTTAPQATAFAAQAWAGLEPCVHCGFCLPACPTYEVTADEADSPRGRIVLMRALERGEIPAEDPDLQRHLDRCLGCRGCESVCPAGVVFGPALEQSRARIARSRPLPPALRLALWVLATPARQRLLWLLSRLLRWTGLPAVLARGAGRDAPVVARLLAMLAATKADRRAGGQADRKRRAPRDPRAGLSAGPPARQSALFRGCVMNGLFSHVHRATVTALAANGFTATNVSGQVCCGALAAHAGADALAHALAEQNVRAFAGTEGPIVVNSAGCGAMMRSYGDVLAGTALETEARAVAARVRDVTELLAEAGPRPGNRLPLRVAYDAPCHLLHGQRVAIPPLQVLSAIPGLELVPLEGSERCCGSAGLYSMIEPALSADVLALKLDAIARAAPEVVATGNPGCLMQIGGGLLLDGREITVAHPGELLAWSYQANAGSRA